MRAEMRGSTHAHPIWTSRSPPQTLDLQPPARVTGITFALFVAFLAGLRQGENTPSNGRLTFLRSRHVLVARHLSAGRKDEEREGARTNIRPFLLMLAGRGPARFC